jgi:hypothetical protein
MGVLLFLVQGVAKLRGKPIKGFCPDEREFTGPK